MEPAAKVLLAFTALACIALLAVSGSLLASGDQSGYAVLVFTLLCAVLVGVIAARRPPPPAG